VAATLPGFARGLKLARLGVFLMLVQLVLGLWFTIKSFGATEPDDAVNAFKWLRYCMITNIVATGVMCIGSASAVGELARFGVSVRGLVYSAIGFAIATLALIWVYHALVSFIDLALGGESTLEELVAAAHRLESAKYVLIAKDIAYGFGLIALLSTVQRSAAASDQLGLRDLAGHHSRALVVMVVGDLFYQLAYFGGGVGYLGVIGSLLVAGYWIYCHLRLTRFLGDAAFFMNEPHDLPIAAVVKGANQKPAKPKPVSPTPAARASAPIAPPVYVPVAPPRAPSSDGTPPDDDGPRILR
jgi:hypothetical protein